MVLLIGYTKIDTLIRIDLLAAELPEIAVNQIRTTVSAESVSTVQKLVIKIGH
ncbi:MAG: hypothetical protein GX639_20615 [Fibrobacter sp.]|nr:hypothetical protein [Fibrobacter sp.]